MDYGALPPEVNSGRMYAGPGSGPMLAASATWDGLARDLYTAAGCYGSVIADLGGVWSGPASTAMAAAAAPYVAWLNAVAGRAEQAAINAKAAAGAYEAAFAMTVPPPVIAANRAQLMALIATNFFGQNLPAIAATEAHYAQMWAQDAVAMYGYASASAAPSTLGAFDRPPPTTDAAGQAGQAAAVAAAAESAGAGADTGTPGTSVAAPALSWLLGQPADSGSWASSPLAQLFVNLYGNGSSDVYHRMTDVYNFVELYLGLPQAATDKAAEAVVGFPSLGAILGGRPGFVAPAAIGASASMGGAATAGNLSVPPSWPTAPPAGAVTAPVAAEGGAGGLLRGIPLTPVGLTTNRHRGGVLTHRYGFRHRVMGRGSAGG